MTVSVSVNQRVSSCGLVNACQTRSLGCDRSTWALISITAETVRVAVGGRWAGAGPDRIAGVRVGAARADLGVVSGGGSAAAGGRGASWLPGWWAVADAIRVGGVAG
ncbi:hypothetical protein [Micromonospora sp. 4G55]|uniref:hypothetical protein n=1 Tax=Micromonospora sp. 4G55 TaxID=2806102 RepID=UPI001EE490B2|nr:hypothetical protein [Micromonospora sp. 4G55]